MKRLDWPRMLPVSCVTAVVLFSLSLLATSAAQLPFWYDESLTVRLSRLGSVGELWRAVTAGFEFTPPLIYLATKLTRALPGPELLTARLPGLIGFALLSCFLFIFLERRLGAWFALISVALLPLADYTVRYAIEARAYMLMLGVSAVALVAWQASVDRRPSSSSMLAPVVLAASVAAALLLHVWAILLPLALVSAEAIETLRTRRIRWRAVVPLLAASPALAVYPILLRSSHTVVFAGPAYAPTLDKLYTAFRSDMPRPRVVAGVLVVAALTAWWRQRDGPSEGWKLGRPEDRATELPNIRTSGLPASELTVLLVLLLSPLVPYVYAVVGDGAFMTRYAMFALPACVALIGTVAHAVGRGDARAGQVAALVALLGVWLYLPPKVPVSGSQSAALESLLSAPSTIEPFVPIVLVNPVDVLAFDDQATSRERARVVYVADSSAALKYTATNGIDLGYERGEPYLNIGVRRVSYDELTRDRSRLYLLGKWQALSWLPQRLRDDGWSFEPAGGTAPAPIFEARRSQE